MNVVSLAVLFVLHFVSHAMPCLFNKSCLCFASQMRAGNFPDHHFLSKTASPSPNLGITGVGAGRGSAVAVQSSVKAGAR